MIYAFGIAKNFMSGVIFSLVFVFTSTCMAVNVDTGGGSQDTLNYKMVTNTYYTGEGVVNVQANKVIEGKSGILAPPLFKPLKITCGGCRYTYETGWYDVINMIPNFTVQVYWNNFENCHKCGKKNWTVKSVRIPPYFIS